MQLNLFEKQINDLIFAVVFAVVCFVVFVSEMRVDPALTLTFSMFATILEKLDCHLGVVLIITPCLSLGCHLLGHSPPSPPWHHKFQDPDDGRQRFLLELEFVQLLANPTYIHRECYNPPHYFLIFYFPNIFMPRFLILGLLYSQIWHRIATLMMRRL